MNYYDPFEKLRDTIDKLESDLYDNKYQSVIRLISSIRNDVDNIDRFARDEIRKNRRAYESYKIRGKNNIKHIKRK